MGPVPLFGRGHAGGGGEKWSLLVLREAFFGVRRFADFQRVLGAPRAVLTDRLATLVDEGILRRVPYQDEGERQRHEYRLTEKGIDLYPTLVALMQWGDRYLADGDVPVELEHKEGGSAVHLALVCEAGHELSGAREVRPVPQSVARSGAPLTRRPTGRFVAGNIRMAGSSD